jgi:hypothetical protein
VTGAAAAGATPDMFAPLGHGLAIPPARPREPIARAAEISACRDFRWTLRRRWGPGPEIGWCMLNPSDADGNRDDPTVRECVAFSTAWGFSALVIVNFIPYRSPSPRAMLAWRMRMTGNALIENARRADAALAPCVMQVAAWGCVAPILLDDLRRFLAPAISSRGPWHCLGTTADGSPKHPLARGRHRTPRDARPQQFDIARVFAKAAA